MPMRNAGPEGTGAAGESEVPSTQQSERDMNEYRPDTPRAAFALGAVGLMALTLGAFVVVPAVFDSGFAPEMTLAKAPAAPVEVAIVPGAIEVVGIREPAARVTLEGLQPVASSVAWALPNSEPCKPQG